ncbi:hypothetical protein R6Q59_025106 [Mikania micrantha]
MAWQAHSVQKVSPEGEENLLLFKGSMNSSNAFIASLVTKDSDAYDWSDQVQELEMTFCHIFMAKVDENQNEVFIAGSSRKNFSFSPLAFAPLLAVVSSSLFAVEDLSMSRRKKLNIITTKFNLALKDHVAYETQGLHKSEMEGRISSSQEFQSTNEQGNERRAKRMMVLIDEADDKDDDIFEGNRVDMEVDDFHRNYEHENMDDVVHTNNRFDAQMIDHDNLQQQIQHPDN